MVPRPRHCWGGERGKEGGRWPPGGSPPLERRPCARQTDQAWIVRGGGSSVEAVQKYRTLDAARSPRRPHQREQRGGRASEGVLREADLDRLYTPISRASPGWPPSTRRLVGVKEEARRRERGSVVPVGSDSDSNTRDRLEWV